MSNIDTKMQQNPYLITLDSGIEATTDLNSLKDKFVKKSGEAQKYKVLRVDSDWVILGYEDEFLPPEAFMRQMPVKRATFQKNYELCQSCI